MNDMNGNGPLPNDKLTRKSTNGEFNKSVMEMASSDKQIPDFKGANSNVPMKPHQLAFDFEKVPDIDPPLERHGHSSCSIPQNAWHQTPSAGLGAESGKQDSTGKSPATDVISGDNHNSAVREPIRFKIAHQKTLHNSLKLARRYCNSVSTEHMSIKDINPVGFANFLLTLKPNLQPVTWRQYAQQFRVFLANQPHRENENALSILQQSSQTPSESGHTDSAGTGDHALKKAGTRGMRIIRVFPKPDFDILLNHFANESRSFFAETLCHWLVAGISTGLHPIDWLTTTIITSKDPDSTLGLRILLKILHVTSADDRSSGIMRTIDISNFQRETIKSVVAMVEFGAMCFEENSLNCCQKPCQDVLRKACKRLFRNTGKNYSLLSLRQQFIANMKSLKDPSEVSALAGHLFAKSTKINHSTKEDAWPRKEILDIPTVVSPPVFVGGENHTAEND